MRAKLHRCFKVFIGLLVAAILLPNVQAGEASSGGVLTGAHYTASLTVPRAAVILQSPRDSAPRSRFYVSVPRASVALGRGWKACLARAWESNCARYAWVPQIFVPIRGERPISLNAGSQGSKNNRVC
jgi:hypothetical protein